MFFCCRAAHANNQNYFFRGQNKKLLRAYSGKQLSCASFHHDHDPPHHGSGLFWNLDGTIYTAAPLSPATCRHFIGRVGCNKSFFRRMSFLFFSFSLKVVMEVRKSAETDAEGLLEGLEAMRRAVIAEGCYPSRLVRVDMEAGRGTLSGPTCSTRMASPRLLRSPGFRCFLVFRSLVLPSFSTSL